MKKLIIFMGPSGVGKHALAEYCQLKNKAMLLVDKREIELSAKDKTPQEHKQIYYNTINKMLSISNTVGVINHHVLAKDRQELFDNLKNIDNIYIIGIWIENSWNNILNNNNDKDSKFKIPIKTLEFLFNYRSSPTKEEPFDNLVYLIMPENIGMSKKHPYIKDVYSTLDRILDEN